MNDLSTRTDIPIVDSISLLREVIYQRRNLMVRVYPQDPSRGPLQEIPNSPHYQLILFDRRSNEEKRALLTEDELRMLSGAAIRAKGRNQYAD